MTLETTYVSSQVVGAVFTGTDPGAGLSHVSVACPCGGRCEEFWAKHLTYKHILHFHVVLICCLKAPSLPLPTHVSTSRPSNLQLQQLVPTLVPEIFINNLLTSVEN